MFETHDQEICSLEVRIDEQQAEIERLRAGFKSEEPQEYCHNEVTGLHNMADLYEIERLRAVVDAAKQELRGVGSGPGWVAYRILKEADDE